MWLGALQALDTFDRAVSGAVNERRLICASFTVLTAGMLLAGLEVVEASRWTIRCADPNGDEDTTVRIGGRVSPDAGRASWRVGAAAAEETPGASWPKAASAAGVPGGRTAGWKVG